MEENIGQLLETWLHVPALPSGGCHQGSSLLLMLSIKWGREAGEAVRNRPDKELGGDKLKHFLAFEF